MSIKLLHAAHASPLPTPSPSPTPTPRAGGSGSSIDVGPILNALNPAHLFGDLLLRLTQQLNDALEHIWEGLWHSSINVFTYTAPELTYRFGPVADLLFGMRLLVGALTAAAAVLAAASLAGRHVFGWGEDLGEHLGRLGLAAILANGSFVLTQQAIDWNNQLCHAIGFASLSPGFSGLPANRLSSGLLVLALFWFGLKLGFKMLYRIGLLWLLISTAPLALACWAIPQAQWVATTWTRQFVGWTFGQVLVTIALKLGFTVSLLAPGGGTEAGLLFAIVMAALSVDLVDLLVYGSVPRLSPIRGITSVVSLARFVSWASGPTRLGTPAKR